MNDTPPEIEKKIHEMMMARSGAERLIMGSSMFDAARRIVLASLPKKYCRMSLSIPTMSSPRSANRRTVSAPINPAEPVTMAMDIVRRLLLIS